MHLPEKGLSQDEVFKHLDAFRMRDLEWGAGKAFGYVFDPGKDAVEVGKKAYMMFLSESGLDVTVYPSLLKMENDIIAFASEHLNGGAEASGNFTSGGTESIILAVKAARDYCRHTKPEIKEPEMILPVTGHAAFHKAGHYLGVKIVPVGVDSQFRADMKQVKAAVTKNTIMIVGSAPSYALGVIDPIREMATLAKSKDIWFHSDCCMGGFLLPYFKRLGEKVPDFDFSIPGVNSISMDLHKYAYTPKGASVVLYRNKNLRKFQIFACARWNGYSMINTTIQSTKTGGPLAAAWAVLNYVGDAGYLEFAKKKLDAVRRIVKGIESIPDLQLMVKPDMVLIAFGSKTVNVFHIIDEMSLRGWYIQPALAFATSKENIHLSVNLSNVAHVDQFLKDLADSTEAAKQLPSGQLASQLQGLMATPGALSPENLPNLLAMVGVSKEGMPDRMAGINEVMNMLPVEAREALLTEFASMLFR